MKILLSHCFYRSSAPSGEDSVYRNEKKLLEDSGFDVITYEKYNDDLDNNSFRKKVSAGVDFVWSKKSYAEISVLLKQHKPDVVHFHNIFPQLSTSVYLACQDQHIPVVQTLHNFRYLCPAGLLQRNGKPCEKCIDKTLLSSLIHRCYRDSIIATLPMTAMIGFNRLAGHFEQGVDRYIALTEFGKSRFIAGGLPAEKISVKPNFIADIGDTHFSLGDYVVYVGRLSQEKGIITLIEACKKNRHIPIKILGDGDLRNKLESTCIEYDLPVEFLGYQNKDTVLSYIKNSRFLVLPSECYEGFPVTIAEAYACGKPVLGSQIGALNEIIQEGVTGRKFHFGDADSLAEIMARLWSDEKAIKEMSANARSAFNQHYNAENNLQQITRIYEEVIAANKNKEKYR